MGSRKSPLSAETQTRVSPGQACQPHPLSLWARAGLQLQLPDSDLGSNRGHQRLLGTMSTMARKLGRRFQTQNLIAGAAKRTIIIHSQ